MSAPLVAIPAYHLSAGRVSGWSDAGVAVPEQYVAAVSRAGARAVVLAANDPSPASEILAPFDGLLLIGGGDVGPHHYGKEPHPTEYLVEPHRDELELALAREALDAGLPLLAICRGLQVLNVAFGGSLHQHLPGMTSMARHGEAPKGDPVDHPVRVAAGSALADICATTIEACNSQHHQGIDRLGDGLVAVGWSDDGLVEAVEADSGTRGWTIGVQWHPERTASADPYQQALFDALADQARSWVRGST